jgi:hypothetical protein
VIDLPGEGDAWRTVAQNRYQWPILNAWAKQKQWPINGEMMTITAEDYKDILTAAFEKETNPRIAKGYDGGIVMLGRRTSKYGKKKFAEWIEWLNAATAVTGIRVPASQWQVDDREAA